jgi:hypothetical protein
MPASIRARIAMIAVSVLRAYRTGGSRKALTPLLTASTPVMAVQPLANDRIRIHRPTTVPAVAGIAGGTTSGAGCPPAWTALITPKTSTASRLMMKRYIGTANARPDSRTPLRFTIVIRPRIARHSSSV